MAYWLLKSEPSVYSFAQLQKDKKTNWNHIRNFQARNYLRTMQVGDQALIYHSNDDKAVVGVAEIVRESYPDPDPEMKGDWLQVDLKPVEPLDQPVDLKTIKGTPALEGLLLIKQSRLSVMPVSKAHFQMILKLGKKPRA